MTGRLTLETADVEWLPWKADGDDATLIAYVGLYRVFLGHDGVCWSWRMDLLGEGQPIEHVDGANGLVSGSLGTAQARVIEFARLLSTLVDEAYREPLPKASTLLGDLEPGVAAGIDDAMAELIDADREERLPASDDAFSAAAEAIHGAVSWLLELGADSTANNAACIERLAAHTVREYAVERAGDIGKPERGPTEGASDAADWSPPRCSEALRCLASDSSWDSGRWHTSVGFITTRDIPKMLASFFADLDARGRPPTGEASQEPSVPRRLVVRARENLKAAGLIGAAREVDGILYDADHLDAAKGDAPTTAPVDVEALRQLLDDLGDTARVCDRDEVTARIRKALAAGRRVAPDLPGWWWLKLPQELPTDMPRKPVFVLEDEAGRLWVRPSGSGTAYPVDDEYVRERWDGPCLQGGASPDAREAIDDARHSMLTARAERDEVRTLLGALIVAVEDAIDIEHETPVVTIRAALDAAKGDA